MLSLLVIDTLLANDATSYRVKIDDLDITMEEYIRLEEKKARRRVYNDALTCKSDFSTELTISPQHIDEFNLKNETSLSECAGEEQNVIYFNDLFLFNVIYPDDLKSDKDNDNDKIDIKQPSGDISVIPSPNVIDTDVDAYAQGSNNLLKTSHGIDTAYPGLWMRRIDFLYSFRHSDATTTHILARKCNMEDHTEQILGSF
ncbi:hypothetical protein Tco_0698752 [Tanacetum coccineum]